MNQERKFTEWFKHATGNEPYPFQIRFACEPSLPELVDVPTGVKGFTVFLINLYKKEKTHG